MVNLLANKLILACSVGLVGVSVVAVPATFVLTSGKGVSEIFRPLNSAIEKAQDQGKSQFDSFHKQLQTNYENFGNEVADNATTAPGKVSTQLQNISGGAKTIAQMANESKENFNYYAFKLGHLIKAILKHIPNITKESIVESIEGSDNDKHLLSFQKIYNIASNEKFTEFLVAMTTVVTKHGSLLENLSNEDNSGIIQVFKELRNNKQEIQKFLSKVKNNADNVQSSSETYQCATKLMMHVLIGKEEMEKISTTISNLKQLLESVKDKLEKEVFQNTGGETMDISVENLNQKLTEIESQSSSILNPCAKK